MRPGITWYNIIGALPDAPPEDIQQAYEAKASLLRPELLSGAPSKVYAAAAQAQGIINAAWQVLGDPASRQRYDEAAGLWRSRGSLDQAGDFPAGSGLPDSDVAADNPGGEVLRSLGALNIWLAQHPNQPGRIPVPDVRGLFHDVFLEVIGRLDIEVTFVQLTQHPMPVDGLVVDQSPQPSAKIHRRGELTVQVWHPPAKTKNA
jgi:curved DNA-binding protein CbpA